MNLKQNSECEGNNSKSRFAEVGVDCQWLILDELNLYDLTQVAQTSQYFSSLATDIFRRRYSKKTFDILSTLTKNSNESISMTNDKVFIQHFEVTSAVLHTFGHLIERFAIGFIQGYKNERVTIMKFLENYCSNSLIEINFEGFDKHVLAIFRKPLPSVEIVTIKGYLEASSGDAMKMNEIFPEMRRLILTHTDIYDPTIFDAKFPNLEHFEIRLLPLVVKQQRPDSNKNFKLAVENLFKRNPQIKVIVFNDCHSFEFVRFASEHLPNLEGIDIDFFAIVDDYEGDEIHFSSVSQLIMSWQHLNIASKVAFDNLESLALSGQARDCMEFVIQNQHLKRLDMFVNALRDADIVKIGDTLPNLEKLNLETDVDIAPESIVKLVGSCKKLGKLTLEPFSQTLYDKLNDELKEWTIKNSDNYIFLEKM